MQLVVDIGNTETVVGLARTRAELAGHWRVSSDVPRTVDELVVLLQSFLGDVPDWDEEIERGVVGSVVPSVTRTWVRTMERVLHASVAVVGPEAELGVRLDVEEPLTVGADRIVNTLAARDLYGLDTIAVDLGTATTYDCISAEGVFLGGVISPGLPAGLEWLGKRAAKLPRVEMDPPARVIGRRTEACIRSGVFYGVIDAIDAMVARIKDEWDKPEALVVATGGYARALGPHLDSVDVVEPFLTLYGLAMAGEILAGDPGAG